MLSKNWDENWHSEIFSSDMERFLFNSSQTNIQSQTVNVYRIWLNQTTMHIKDTIVFKYHLFCIYIHILKNTKLKAILFTYTQCMEMAIYIAHCRVWKNFFTISVQRIKNSFRSTSKCSIEDNYVYHTSVNRCSFYIRIQIEDWHFSFW